MRVALGTFACSSIEARFGSEAAAGVEAALRHYTRRIKSRRPPIGAPVFCRDRAPARAEFELAVGPEIEAALKGAAREQGVPIDVLLTHAVFVYLAELDATVPDNRRRFAEEDADTPRYPEDALLSTGDLLPPRDRGAARAEGPIAPRCGNDGSRARDRGGARKR